MIEAITGGLKQCRKNDDGSLTAEFKFSPESLVFAGHFPGNPILPGICQMEAIKIILEKLLERQCRLKQFGSVKFFRALPPNELASFTININSQTGNDISITARIHSGNNKISEFKAGYELA